MKPARNHRAQSFIVLLLATLLSACGPSQQEKAEKAAMQRAIDSAHAQIAALTQQVQDQRKAAEDPVLIEQRREAGGKAEQLANQRKLMDELRIRARDMGQFCEAQDSSGVTRKMYESVRQEYSYPGNWRSASSIKYREGSAISYVDFDKIAKLEFTGAEVRSPSSLIESGWGDDERRASIQLRNGVVIDCFIDVSLYGGKSKATCLWGKDVRTDGGVEIPFSGLRWIRFIHADERDESC